MDFFRDVSVALRGQTGAPQTAVDTIAKLSDRLSPATLLADRRAAVLSLKGLARDCKQEVGDRALTGLLEVLSNDAELDADIGKAVLETLHILCEVEDNTIAAKELGFKHTDDVLSNEKATYTMFSLLGDTNFYTRFATLQYLGVLLQNRRQVVQSYFLTAPNGATNVIAVLEDKREIVRNGERLFHERNSGLDNLLDALISTTISATVQDCITMVQSLISQNPDIQKILAFEGAFEKLLNIVTQEGGVEGGIVAQEAFTCVEGLLRFNTSNQSYFSESTLPTLICSLLLFPSNLQIQDPAPQEFALQFWDRQKLANAHLVISIMGMLTGPKGKNLHQAQELSTFTRCFIEIALASNAPTPLKTQALRLLPTNLSFPLSELLLTPYIPVPESNGEEWDRLEQASALDALVELVLHGEYNGLEDRHRIKHGLELRGSAVAVFENFVRKEEIKQAIVQAMLSQEGSGPSEQPPITPLLQSLSLPPSTPLNETSVTTTYLATLLFSHLLRSSPHTKELARLVTPAPIPLDAGSSTFIPADGPPPPEVKAEKAEEDDEPPQTLLQILSENLSLSFLSRSRANTSERESREWDRLVVGYLCLFSQWLWDNPGAVRDFLQAGGLGLLVEPINQPSEADAIVPGLCVFLLGVCYEFNREPGEITRATIHPILNRLGIDTLIGRMARLREDERFKAIGPDSIVLPYPTPSHLQPGLKPEFENEGEIWFDWAFVDFWKSNYYTVQRGLSTDPDTQSSASGQTAETATLVASLRQAVSRQSQEIEELQSKLKEGSSGGNEVAALQSQIAKLSSELRSSEEKRKEVEKEQEDLLVLLDEVTTKRRRDKARLRDAGLEVSEDEADDEGGEDDS